MTATGSRRNRWIVPALLILCLATIGSFVARELWRSWQIEAATDQTRWFESLRARALASVRPQEIIVDMENTINARSSPIRQSPGSGLDRMVERARRLAVADIVLHLKQTTGVDLGDDPQRWIEKYGNEVQQDAPPNGGPATPLDNSSGVEGRHR